MGGSRVHCRNVYPTDLIMKMQPKASADRKHPSDGGRLNGVPARNMEDLIVKRVIQREGLEKVLRHILVSGDYIPFYRNEFEGFMPPSPPAVIFRNYSSHVSC